jgi:Rrf2 family transcriptional regulator, nitric oxide-sensitive transcriptional repressor
MQLTLYSDFSLRTLIYLAVKGEGATVGEIADRYGISRNHLVKVVHHLGKLGYINTTRGKSGGIVLAHAPDQINVGKVVRDVEPHFHLVECFNGSPSKCPLTPECRLKGVLMEAQQVFLRCLDGYTLADLTANGEALRDLLAIRSPSVAARTEL